MNGIVQPVWGASAEVVCPLHKSILHRFKPSCCVPVVAGLTLHLDSLNIHNPSALYNAEGVVGNVMVATTAKIGHGCKIGPDVSIGEGCVIGDGVRLSNCVVMRGVEVGHHSKVGHKNTGRHTLQEYCGRRCARSHDTPL